MEPLQLLHYLSILLEAVVAVLGVLVYLNRKKAYGLGIALTFAIYVFYDSAKEMALSIPQDMLYIVFFVATLSILWAAYSIYSNK